MPTSGICYLIASAPAWATWPSWCDCTTDTPIAPMTLPPATMGTPPSAALVPKPDAAAGYGFEHLGRAAKLSGGSCFLFRDAS